MALKAGGFQLDADDIVKVASNYCGKALPRYPNMITSLSLYRDMCEKLRLGSLRLITVMKGSKELVRNGEKPYWFHVIVGANLQSDEDELEYSDVPFDINHEEMRRVVDIMKGYGLTEKELEDRWVTLTGFNVRQHEYH